MKKGTEKDGQSIGGIFILFRMEELFQDIKEESRGADGRSSSLFLPLFPRSVLLRR